MSSRFPVPIRSTPERSSRRARFTQSLATPLSSSRDCLLQPPRAEGDGRKGERRADAEIGPEADLDSGLARAFGDDEIRNRSEEREIPGESRGHRQSEPGLLRLGK